MESAARVISPLHREILRRRNDSFSPIIPIQEFVKPAFLAEAL
jgi:hypothetical protein